jgi:uncharacterized protein YbjT (DUF2867 family)
MHNNIGFSVRFVMKVMVAGATGQTGRRVVAQLVERGIAVKALVRDLAKAQDSLPATGVEVVQGDVLQPETLTAALQDCTAVICATGAQPSFDVTGPYKVDFVGTQNLIKATKAAGISPFVMVSSLCVSNFFHPLNLFWLVLFWKKQAEDYLQKSGLTYTIVRPGGLRNEDNSDPIVIAPADSLFEGSIARSLVAQVAIDALSEPKAQNRIVEIVNRSEANQAYASTW